MKIQGQETLKKLGPVIKAKRGGRMYVRLKFKNHGYYMGLVERTPLFPNWLKPEEQLLPTNRVFLTARDAKFWAIAVGVRYMKLASIYWRDYYAGPRGWFRKLLQRFNIKLFLRNILMKILQ